MNADLMITIAFCLWVLVGSLALAAFARAAGEDGAAEAEAKRPEPAPQHEVVAGWRGDS